MMQAKCIPSKLTRKQTTAIRIEQSSSDMTVRVNISPFAGLCYVFEDDTLFEKIIRWMILLKCVILRSAFHCIRATGTLKTWRLDGIWFYPTSRLTLSSPITPQGYSIWRSFSCDIFTRLAFASTFLLYFSEILVHHHVKFLHKKIFPIRLF